MAHALISVAEMAALDARAAAFGAPKGLLMEGAGAAVAEEAARRREGRDVCVICGPGANGGDGLVAARLLRAHGAPVQVSLLEGLPPRQPDAAAALEAWGGVWSPLVPEAVPTNVLVIDAMFGTGLTRPLRGAAAALADRRINAILAIDVPSGLPGDGEAPLGPVLQAEVTVTFVAKRPAHVLEPGRSLCGDVLVADIGMPQAVLDEAPCITHENHPLLWSGVLPQVSRASHKHARGHAMVLSGPAHATGAARLAALSALRAGAGLVTLLSPPEAVAVNAAHLTAVMLRAIASPDAFREAIGGAQAIVLGPGAGIGPALIERVKIAAAGNLPLVLDADALTSFQASPAELFAVLRPQDVLTPHWGEFRRLFPDLAAAGTSSKLTLAREAAARSGAVLLLKGSDTVVAAPDGRAAVNTTGSPYLATAGSGDVLAGIIAGLIAQGMPSWEAACAGAWLHGRAGELLGAGLIAEDLPAAVAAAWRHWLL